MTREPELDDLPDPHDAPLAAPSSWPKPQVSPETVSRLRAFARNGDLGTTVATPIVWPDGPKDLPIAWQVVIMRSPADTSDAVEISFIKASAHVRDGDAYVFTTVDDIVISELPTKSVQSVATVSSVAELLDAVKAALGLE